MHRLRRIPSRSVRELAHRNRLYLPTIYQSSLKFSSNSNSEKDGTTFKETLKKVQDKFKQGDSTTTESEKTSDQNKSDESNVLFNNIKTNLLQAYDLLVDNLQQAYDEMTGKNKSTTLERRVQQAESYRKPKRDPVEDDEEVDEPKTDAVGGAIVLVKEPTSAWEQMKNRLNDSPLIREILKKTKQFTEAAQQTDAGKVAQKLGQSVQDRIEDAKEFWATSQNPLVYTVSGIVDNLTSETEEGMAIREIRKLDPSFIPEEWAEDVRRNLAPIILRAHIQGEIAPLKPWLGQAVFNKLAADIRLRKADGIAFDPNILDIEENRVIIRLVEGEGPIILVIYMVQQINCVRNRAGEIIEGAENEIRAKFYSMAFKLDYLEDEGVVKWKIIDYEFAGDMPYI